MKSETRHRVPRLGLFAVDPKGWMGGANYVRNLVECLSLLEEARRPEIRLLFVNDLCDGYEDLRADGRVTFEIVQPTAVPARPKPSRLDRLLGRASAPLPRPLPSAHIDVCYPVMDTGWNSPRALYWIPDFQHEYLPEFFTPDDIAWRRQNLARIAEEAYDVVLSSTMASADFARLAPTAKARTHVWRFCSVVPDVTASLDAVRLRYALPENFVYLANQFWAHKDHRTAFEALGRVAQRDPQITFVCTGQLDDHRNPDYVPQLRRRVEDLGLAARILFLGLIPRADQIALFRLARGVLQPSLFEGWSTVIEDAKAVGCPVLASDFPVHIEQLGSSGRYFRRGDVDACALALEKAWQEWSTMDISRRTQDPARQRQRQLQAGTEFIHILQSLDLASKAAVT